MKKSYAAIILPFQMNAGLYVINSDNDDLYIHDERISPQPLSGFLSLLARSKWRSSWWCGKLRYAYSAKTFGTNGVSRVVLSTTL